MEGTIFESLWNVQIFSLPKIKKKTFSFYFRSVTFINVVIFQHKKT